jgi:hypothetical protein
VVVTASAVLRGVPEKGPGRQASQPHALPRQMGLVRVACVSCEQVQSVSRRRPALRHRELSHGEKTLEPQDPVECLGWQLPDRMASSGKTAPPCGVVM